MFETDKDMYNFEYNRRKHADLGRAESTPMLMRTDLYGQYPIKFILPEFVFYLGERGVMFKGNGWPFCTSVLMNIIMQYNVSGL